ncbi:acyl carrier protein [Pseudomonas gingeri]|uniref:acyl carrier protein n=1 Tax=Pseudomonas gingeri TaxID=117681 RepID=UPI0015A34CAB|nr:acyl carrier protein [Pseudomonas gingeri]NWA26354.1 acyl carrier protein [Pseudomonas gingeri]NWD67867.1 acyl carrier protein [Pseudomonas gingeri]NWD75130.1 acyl carrier protein [Pseudomonas gingeri]
MNRLEIHQQICHSIEEQLSLKWLQDPSKATEDAYSLDLIELFHNLECLFDVRLDLNRDLRGITTLGDLSRFIYEKTRPSEFTLLGTVPPPLPQRQQRSPDA